MTAFDPKNESLSAALTLVHKTRLAIAPTVAHNFRMLAEMGSVEGGRLSMSEA